MNIVDKLVKDSILKYFSIFPTRMHVLTHCILGNGTSYEWIKKDDGLVYLESVSSRGADQKAGIEMIDPKNHDRANKTQEKSAELSNLIRAWIEDNIDEYSKKGFKAVGFNYNPNVKSSLFSRGYNRLCDIQDMSKVAPVWRDAILELCEYFMEKMSVGGIPCFSLKNRDYMKENKDQFLILFNAREKIKALNPNSDYGVDLTNRLLAKMSGDKPLSELLEEDWSNNLEGEMSLDDFMNMRRWFIDNKDVMGRREIIYYIEEFVKSTKLYFDEAGEFTDFFYDEIKVFF